MRNTVLAASAFILALGAVSAFAIPSGDRLANPENSVPTFGYSAPYGHAAHNGFAALAPSNADDGSQYTPLPLTNRGR
jgi:hypothetical protein